MSDPAYGAILRRDAVDQLALNPTASHRWHSLVDLSMADPAPAACDELAALVRARIRADGVAGFFRATFLFDLVGDRAELTRAGELLLTIRPYDADRLMAFTVYQWGVAVAHAGGHASLREQLSAARAPALMVRAGMHLSAAAAGMIAPRRVTALHKVALLAPFLGNAFHPPTAMVLQQAEVLCSLGLQVKLFAPQEFLQPHMAHYLGCRGSLTIDPPELTALAARIPNGVEASLGDARVSMMRRWLDTLAGIARFDPDLVMFVGLSSPLMQPLYAARPTLGLGIHAVSPMAPLDAWLTADPARAGLAASEWGAELPAPEGHYHPYRVQLAPPTAARTREEFGIAPDQLAMVTVGARLHSEIAGPWAARMLETLARHPQMVWLLIGAQGELPPALAAANPAQLRLLPHRTDLRSVVRCCDIYLNPPRLGGGFSAAEAMAEGLPVLALANGDAGSKLAGMACVDDDAWFSQLEALLASAPLRAQTGAAMQSHFRHSVDLASSGPSLLQACELALHRFRARQG